MGIKSSPFGRVTLTDEDAAKFQRQVQYGRPKAAAVAGVQRGIELVKTMQKSGAVTIKASGTTANR